MHFNASAPIIPTGVPPLLLESGVTTGRSNRFPSIVSPYTGPSKPISMIAAVKLTCLMPKLKPAYSTAARTLCMVYVALRPWCCR